MRNGWEMWKRGRNEAAWAAPRRGTGGKEREVFVTAEPEQQERRGWGWSEGL